MHENKLQPNNKAQDIYSFGDATQRQLFTKVIHELRCNVCPNQSLSDSMAPLAIDLRNEIYQKVQSHYSESEIVDFVTHRYGEFVLYNPPLQWNTAFLWFTPLLILVTGLFIAGKYLKRE